MSYCLLEHLGHLVSTLYHSDWKESVDGAVVCCFSCRLSLFGRSFCSVVQATWRSTSHAETFQSERAGEKGDCGEVEEAAESEPYDVQL